MSLSLDYENDSLLERKMIKLISNDHREFEIDVEYCQNSDVIKAALEDKKSTEIPLPSIKGDILKIIVDYMNHHKGVELELIEKPLKSSIMKEVCKDPWDAEFIDEIARNKSHLYDVIGAANNLSIKTLLYLGAAKVASLIRGKPTAEIENILKVEENLGETKCN